jgi:hypothetical protein
LDGADERMMNNALLFQQSNPEVHASPTIGLHF